MDPLQRYSEYIVTDAGGRLRIEDCYAAELAAVYGTPLYVTSEAQVRHNYRRIRSAFTAAYPRTEVLYAIKANNNLAIRRILTEEGAGGECFGMSELWATLAGGTDPERVVLNGSNKSRQEMAAAISSGVRVNVDSLQELGELAEVAAGLGRTARIRIRVKPEMPELRGIPSQSSPGLDLEQRVHAMKWGLDFAATCAAVRLAQEANHLELEGFSFHFSRQTDDPRHFGWAAKGFAEFAARVRDATGFVPDVLDFGGGIPHGRDPEGKGKTAGARPVQEYAAAIGQAILAACRERGLGTPLLEVEPGRFIVGNTTVLIAAVGVVKPKPGGGAWVHVDASTNQLMRLLQGYYYTAIPVTRGVEPPTGKVDLVGPLCSPDVLVAGAAMPALGRGDLVAILDAGMYAETTSSQFNGLPRPATVLVSGARHELIRRRETIADVFATQRVPEHLGGPVTLPAGGWPAAQEVDR